VQKKKNNPFNIAKNWNVKKMKSFKPNIYSAKYNSKVVAVEFDETCLNGVDPTEKLQLLTSKYTCLTSKEVYTNEGNTIFRNHGGIFRTYMEIIFDENNNNCIKLNEELIDWNEYCIEDISYDMILELDGVCADDITNGIYYGSTKKPDAWSLDMLDSSTLNNKFSRPKLDTLGNDNGVDIWILDTGIYSNHKEFAAGQIIDEVSTLTYTAKHGTNSASVAGGVNYGSSKGFYIHDYIVCRNSDGGCSFSDIEKGLQAVLAHMKKTGRRSVINLSVGSSGANQYVSTQSYYDKLFTDINNAGGIITVSAGNGNQDACNWWFSYSDKVVSIGAHDKNKIRSSFSNYGLCVDVYAPGTSVPAANSISDPTNVGYVSGTSFSSPMMAGIIANLLYEDRTRTKADILKILQTATTRYPITNCPSGYCYGYYYTCKASQPSSLTVNDADNDEINGVDDQHEEATVGCCKPVRDINRLIDYCASLTLNDCMDNKNENYCYIDTDASNCD